MAARAGQRGNGRVRQLAPQGRRPRPRRWPPRCSLPFDHPAALGAIGATGSAAANSLAREADLVIGAGTRWSDFSIKLLVILVQNHGFQSIGALAQAARRAYEKAKRDQRPALSPANRE